MLDQSPPSAIASVVFDLLAEGAEPQRIEAWVGRPAPDGDGDASCPCGLETFGPAECKIFGVDSMQALSLAIKFLHRRLSDELERHTILHADTTQQVTQEDLDFTFAR
jgi:hypothetical protein